MCDTLVHVSDERVLFAKNSDRNANEAQLLEWHPRRSHAKGTSVGCTWIEIPQVRETSAVLLSRPFWMWGAEIGANEHGVVIGNEAVFTRGPYAKTGLTGMDLLRLALERADSAKAAVDVIIALLEEHGQGGGCGHENRNFTYHNSYIIADSRGAFVLETAAREHAVEKVTGGRSISNGLTIPGFTEAHTDRLRTWVSACRLREARTRALIQQASGPADMMRILRDHGEAADGPPYRLLNGGMSAVCMHAGGLAAAGQTTSSWVAELRPQKAQHWVTGTAAPCLSLFKPIGVDEPLDLGPPARDMADDSLWWRHERLHRAVMRDPATLAPLFNCERDEVEARWLTAPPEPCEAFREADRLLACWTRRVMEHSVSDRRPFYIRRFWAKRNARARL